MNIFDRSMIKNNAKIPLRQTYWMAFAVSLFFTIVGNFSINITVNLDTLHNIMRSLMYYGSDFRNVFINIWTGIFLSVMGLTFSIAGIAIKIFVINCFELGHAGFYMANRKAPARFTEVFSGFSQNYLGKMLVMFMRDLFIALWTLLFIIPGIVAEYKYWAVKYILNENPNLSWQHALDMSKRMTFGRKFDLWMLDLSFIGWYLLGALALGIGVFFVHPYHAQTQMEAYEFIKQDALANNRISYNEFNDVN